MKDPTNIGPLDFQYPLILSASHSVRLTGQLTSASQVFSKLQIHPVTLPSNNTSWVDAVQVSTSSIAESQYAGAWDALVTPWSPQDLRRTSQCWRFRKPKATTGNRPGSWFITTILIRR